MKIYRSFSYEFNTKNQYVVIPKLDKSALWTRTSGEINLLIYFGEKKNSSNFEKTKMPQKYQNFFSTTPKPKFIFGSKKLFIRLGDGRTSKTQIHRFFQLGDQDGKPICGESEASINLQFGCVPVAKSKNFMVHNTQAHDSTQHNSA